MDKDENSNLCISYHHIFNNIPVLFQPKFWQDNVVKDCLLHRGIYIQLCMYSALPFSKITLLNKIMLCMLTENKWFWDQWSRKESTPTCSNVTMLCVWNKVTIRVRVQKKTKKTKCGMISILNLSLSKQSCNICQLTLQFKLWLNCRVKLVCIALQDTLGGGFDATQAYVGELANLNIWNRKLSVAEIYNLATCNSKAPAGNVFSWTESNIEIFGGATKWTFEPCRSLNWTAFHHSRKGLSVFLSFCRSCLHLKFVRDYLSYW